jgi:hypothetical protein
MVECETCHAWQHGPCMGFANPDLVPKHYFCEKCLPESWSELLQYVSPSSSILNSSRYLPWFQEVRETHTPKLRHLCPQHVPHVEIAFTHILSKATSKETQHYE